MYSTSTKSGITGETITYLTSLVKKGGPEPHDDLLFTDIVNHLKEEEVETFREAIREALNENTLIGHGFVKPYGYPGDYSIIHRIYKKAVNQDSKYSNWDRFFQDQAGAHAVRNRKEYFHQRLEELEKSPGKILHVLILGSGPATDVCEYLRANPETRIVFSLIDFDQKAIDFAMAQNKRFNGSVEYHRINVLRYKPVWMFDMIWSAGLFDYFRDKHFIYMINKYYKYLDKDGEFIIGNFSSTNPTKRLMEVLSDWYLNHRSKYDLIRLADEASIPENKVTVDMEQLGVNLFLRLKN